MVCPHTWGWIAAALPLLVRLCHLDTAYITLGGNWSDPQEDTLYVVGIGSSSFCNPRLVQLVLVTNGHRQLVKSAVLSRTYVTPAKDAKRFYYFFNVTRAEVENSECHFNYQVRHKDKSTRIYRFRSELFCQKYFATYFLGQHDNSVVGLRATEHLQA